MLIAVYDVNILLIVLTTQRDGFDKKTYFCPEDGGSMSPETLLLPTKLHNIISH